MQEYNQYQECACIQTILIAAVLALVITFINVMDDYRPANTESAMVHEQQITYGFYN